MYTLKPCILQSKTCYRASPAIKSFLIVVFDTDTEPLYINTHDHKT